MKDKVSALLDGDLDEQATRMVFDGLRRDPDLRRDWEAYCLIGDVLRGDREGSDDFVSRVMANLDAEPTVPAPRAAPACAGPSAARAASAAPAARGVSPARCR